MALRGREMMWWIRRGLERLRVEGQAERVEVVAVHVGSRKRMRRAGKQKRCGSIKACCNQDGAARQASLREREEESVGQATPGEGLVDMELS